MANTQQKIAWIERSNTDELPHEFFLEDWHVDVLSNTLSQGADKHQVPTKIMSVLSHLANNHSRLVTRQELIDVIWSGNVNVGEKALNNAIWRLRQVLENSDDAVNFIRTTPKSGYKLMVVPRSADSEQAESTHDSAQDRGANKYLPHAMVVSLLAIITSVSIPYLSAKRSPVLLAQPTTKNLTQLPGMEISPAPSPSGTVLAFQYVDSEGSSGVFVKPFENPEAKAERISDESAYASTPAWAPDGVHLAFWQSDDQTGPRSLMVKNVKTKQQNIIESNVSSDYTALAWSPDGRWLAYSGQQPGVGEGLYLKLMDTSFSPAVETSDIRISCVQCDYADREVSWSPDSKKMAVTRVRNRLSENIHIYDLEAKKYEQLTFGEISVQGHTWYKDNERLVYSAQQYDSTQNLWMVNGTTKEKRKLGYEDARSPVYINGHEQLVLYEQESKKYIAGLLTREDSEIHGRYSIPIVQTTHSARNPDYSAAANALVYFSNLSGHDEIWIADPLGKNASRLTDLKSKSIDPAWSPDGKSIVFTSSNVDDDSTQLSIVDVATQNVRTFPTGFNDIGTPSWAADGQSLILPIRQNQSSDLWRFSLDGDSHHRITHSGAEYGRESLDGEYVYYTRHNVEGLYRAPRNGGLEELVIDDIRVKGVSDWTWIEPDILMYERLRGDHVELVEFFISSNKKTVVAELPRSSMHTEGMLSYSHENNIVYYTHLEPLQTDLIRISDPLVNIL